MSGCVRQNPLQFFILFSYIWVLHSLPAQTAFKHVTAMANRIDTVTARNKLKIQREPYWHRISKGCYVGLRKMSDSSDGTWRVRYRDSAGSQLAASLGTLDEYPSHEHFDRAVAAARE